MIRAKKSLGQHFLNDINIAHNIVDALKSGLSEDLIEVGPGTGVLSQILLKRNDFRTLFIEIDHESIDFLTARYPEIKERIVQKDFLKFDISANFNEQVSVIGNFPYNISSQIFFKILEYRWQIPQVVCMIQKEVAERIASPPGNKTYGILSVFLQAFYDIEYLFTVHEHVFNPPPKVKSGVIRLIRNNTDVFPCDEVLFRQVVKTGFNQRRKTLSNSLKSLLNGVRPEDPIFLKRPEQLSVEQFIYLTKIISEFTKKNK